MGRELNKRRSTYSWRLSENTLKLLPRLVCQRSYETIVEEFLQSLRSNKRCIDICSRIRIRIWASSIISSRMQLSEPGN